MSENSTIETAPFGVVLPPTQYELPCDDGIPMETQRHKMQMDILIDTLWPWLAQRDDGYAGGNMFVYYSMAQVRNQDFKGPDMFVVLGVPKGERRSWVVWEEGKAPDVVIELLSESTAGYDKTEKKQIYQDRVRVPEYYWYDPFDPEDWAGFTLHNGVYQPLSVDSEGRFISQQLGLALVRWSGFYKDVEAVWLRWATLDGILLPTSQEEAAQAQQEVAQAQQEATQAQQEAAQAEERANEAEQRAARLAAQLRSLGIDPEG
jgi:Uma2 family endonuclease